MSERSESRPSFPPWRAPGRRSRPGRMGLVTPAAESLERRQVPALLGFPAGVVPVSGLPPTETVDRALDLGDLGASRAAGAIGAIGAGPAAAADVAWYHFTLDALAEVSLAVGPGSASGTFRGVI